MSSVISNSCETDIQDSKVSLGRVGPFQIVDQRVLTSFKWVQQFQYRFSWRQLSPTTCVLRSAYTWSERARPRSDLAEQQLALGLSQADWVVSRPVELTLLFYVILFWEWTSFIKNCRFRKINYFISTIFFLHNPNVSRRKPIGICEGQNLRYVI